MRTVIAVIVGYVSMFVVIFVTFTIAYLAMGTEAAFRPGVYDASMLWIAVSFVLGLLAAIAGGWVCAVVGRTAKACQALAVFVFALGVLMAIPVLTAAPPADVVRSAAVSNMEAMTKARTPRWVALLNPFVGVVGVIIGGRLRRSSNSA